MQHLRKVSLIIASLVIFQACLDTESDDDEWEGDDSYEETAAAPTGACEKKFEQPNARFGCLQDKTASACELQHWNNETDEAFWPEKSCPDIGYSYQMASGEWIYSATDALTPGAYGKWADEAALLNLRCDVPESLVPGYWCLSVGSASAPHMYKDLGLEGETWHSGNVCLSYGNDGIGLARFENTFEPVSTEEFRYGVMSRSSGIPEVSTTGHWLLFHEGIDPQVAQLIYNPETGAVGEDWPFVKGACPF